MNDSIENALMTGKIDMQDFLPYNKPKVEIKGTALSGIINSKKQQAFYLWEESNIPSITTYEVNDKNYFDNPNFRPYITSVISSKEQKKGAILLCAGGSFKIRGNDFDCYPVAEDMSRLGYQCFVIDYRLRPYTPQEGALDVARGIRFIKSHASKYGYSPDNVAVIGFSAGGILAGEMILNYSGYVNGTILDYQYEPDYLDEISANVTATGMIYAHYGVLCYANTDVEKFIDSNVPPTFFACGTNDPFYEEVNKSITTLNKANIPTEAYIMKDWSHGFGNKGGWIEKCDVFLEKIFNITTSNIK